ncbi:MAG: sulfite exporter TauE/SafE family protein [Ruminococcus sp.]|nr:sulfite exporter TauE/SafE family protein [Candidatus Apopatosoma intestinale]
MELFIKILVCFLAGAGAGIGTGFAGMSAVAVIAPMLITFLGIPGYEAVGIGLASDVLASAVSALTYRKNGNIDAKNGTLLMVFVLLFTGVGSFVGSLLPDTAMESVAVVATLLLGIRFLVWPVLTTREMMETIPKPVMVRRSILGGIGIGFICGFAGAGGGMMMLLILTSLLGYELKAAVGTSVFVMTFTALTGSVSHFAILYTREAVTPDLVTLLLCVVFTFAWARVAALIANKIKTKTMNIVTGSVLVVLSVVVLVVGFLNGEIF